MNKGDHEAAVKDFSKAIGLNPLDSMGYVNRGHAWSVKGEFDSAIRDFSEAIRLDRKDAAIYFGRGTARASIGKYDGAIEDFSDVIRLDAHNTMAYVHRASAWCNIGDYDSTIKDCTDAIRLDLNNATAYSIRGYAWRSKGDCDAAIKDYSDAIRLEPNNPCGYNSLAWLRAVSQDDAFRDGKKAVELATKACELSRWATWYCIGTLAAAYAESGDWENAISRQEQAVHMATDQNDKQGGLDRLELYKQKKPYREQK